MALGDPNDPLAPYLDATVPLDDDALFRMYFGQDQSTPIVPPVAEPIPLDAPIQVPRGSDPPRGPAPIPPPTPPKPPGPTDPTYPGPRPSQAGPDVPTGNALPDTPFYAPPAEDTPPEIQFDLGPENDLSQTTPLDLFQSKVDEANREAGTKLFTDQISGDARVEALTNEYLSGPEGELKFRLDLADREQKRADLETPAIMDAARARVAADQIVVQAGDQVARMMAQNDADAAALSSNETWFDRAGTGTKIAGYLAAAIAGFLNPTGPNSVVELIKAASEGDVRRRQAAMQERRASAGTMLDTAIQQRDAAYIQIQGTYQYALNKIDEQMSNLDPHGARAMNLAATKNAIIGEMQSAAKAAHKERLDEALSLAELDLKGAQAAKADAEAAIAARKASGVGSGGGKLTAEQLAARYPGQPVPTDGIPRTDKEYSQWLVTVGRGLDVSGKEHSAARGDFGGLVQPDDGGPGAGETFRATGSDTDVTAAKNVYLGMQSVVSAIDEMARNYTGLTSDLLASEENQRIKSAWQRARVHLGKTFQLGALAEADLKIVDGFLTSGKDPSGFRNVLTALTSARDGIIEDAQNALRLAGYRGNLRKEIPPIPKDTGRYKSPDEKAFAGILKVGDPKVLGPLARRLKGIVVDGAEDSDINRDAAVAMLRLIKKRGGKFKGYAADVLGLADIPRYKAEDEESRRAFEKLGGPQPQSREPDADADFFKETPDDLEARYRRDILEFETENGL